MAWQLKTHFYSIDNGWRSVWCMYLCSERVRGSRRSAVTNFCTQYTLHTHSHSPTHWILRPIWFDAIRIILTESLHFVQFLVTVYLRFGNVQLSVGHACTNVYLARLNSSIISTSSHCLTLLCLNLLIEIHLLVFAWNQWHSHSDNQSTGSDQHHNFYSFLLNISFVTRIGELNTNQNELLLFKFSLRHTDGVFVALDIVSSNKVVTESSIGLKCISIHALRTFIYLGLSINLRVKNLAKTVANRFGNVKFHWQVSRQKSKNTSIFDRSTAPNNLYKPLEMWIPCYDQKVV